MGSSRTRPSKMTFCTRSSLRLASTAMNRCLVRAKSIRFSAATRSWSPMPQEDSRSAAPVLRGSLLPATKPAADLSRTSSKSRYGTRANRPGDLPKKERSVVGFRQRHWNESDSVEYGLSLRGQQVECEFARERLGTLQ